MILVPADEIVVAEGIVKAFGDRDGLHLDYNAIKRDGITALYIRLAVDICWPDDTGFTYEKTYAYFDRNRFDPMLYGDIYTDGQFLQEVNKLLQVLGIKGKLFYTELGMQGDNFVSLEGDDEYVKGMLEYVFRSKENENLPCVTS